MCHLAHSEINRHYLKIIKLVLATKNHQESAKKNIQQSLTPAVLKNGFFNLPDSNVPKGPAHNETHQHYSKIQLENIKSLQKNKQNLKKILKY